MLRIIILIVALGAGGLAAWLALNMQPRAVTVAAPAPPPPGPKMTEVLVAAGDLAQGHVLAEENLRWQPWPETALTPAFITKSKRADAQMALKGSLVRNHFLAGEPIREEKLARGNGLLAALLPSGKRAVAIRISVESTAGGFILPNDRVDVIQTVKRPGDIDMSRILLTNIRVLAIDQRADEAKGLPVALGRTATLELDPTQTEIITAAQATSQLSLSLRSLADNDQSSGVQQSEAVTTVWILRGGRGEVVKVR